jgi:hypothetical protein
MFRISTALINFILYIYMSRTKSVSKVKPKKVGRPKKAVSKEKLYTDRERIESDFQKLVHSEDDMLPENICMMCQRTMFGYKALSVNKEFKFVMSFLGGFTLGELVMLVIFLWML